MRLKLPTARTKTLFHKSCNIWDKTICISNKRFESHYPLHTRGKCIYFLNWNYCYLSHSVLLLHWINYSQYKKIQRETHKNYHIEKMTDSSNSNEMSKVTLLVQQYLSMNTIFGKIYLEFTRFHKKSWFELKV